MTGAVTEVHAWAVIDGARVEVDRFEVTREIGTGLPSAVAQRSALFAATADADVQESDVATTTKRPPWKRIGAWPPRVFAPAEVHVQLDAAEHVRFRGKVDNPRGSALAETFVSMLDDVDRLHREVSHPPLMAPMPPYTPGGQYRFISLHADYYVDRVLRAAGWYCTPPAESGCVVSVPAQGSMWPEVGACIDAGQLAPVTVQSSPDWWKSPWGYSYANARAAYAPSGASTILADGLQITLSIAPEHAGLAYVNVYLEGRVETVRLLVTASKRIEAAITDGVGLVTAWTPPAGWRTVELRIVGTTWELRTDNGGATSVDVPTTTAIASARVSNVRISADGTSRVGAFQVSHPGPGPAFQAVQARQTATIQVGAVLGQLRAAPAITATDGLDLLGQIAEATCASMWIGLDGHFWWVHPDRMQERAKAPSKVLTAAADVLDLAWDESSDAARQSVTVRWREALGATSTVDNITVWQGQSQTLDPGQIVEDIAKPPTGEDWIMVADAVRWAGDGDTNFNKGRQSYIGGVLTDDTEFTTWASSEELEVVMERLGINTYRFRHHVLTPPTGKTVVTQTVSRDTASTLTPRWREQGLPLLRARGRINWVDQSYTSATVGDPIYPPFVHDVGAWVQDDAGPVRRLADWLASTLTQPKATLHDVPVMYDPSIELGQAVTIREDVVYGVELDCIVTAIHEQGTADGGLSMTLTAWVGAVRPLWDSYAALAATGQTYQQLTARGVTYAELAADPTGGTR